MEQATRLRGSEGPLRFSAFVPAQTVSQTLAEPGGCERAIKLFRANRIHKVYLDCLRGGLFPGEETLIQVRDRLREHGFQVAAGLTPTRGTGKGSTHGRWWLCYTNLETQAELTEVVRRTARLFDEIIVDDFLCTQCQCEECQMQRAGRCWETYYGELLVQVGEECILKPSRAENPQVQVAIKYPQWYDRFHKFGYDVLRHPAQFDEVWVGTEIRDPRVEYVHQYQAFANYQWLASLSGEKIGGAWFDFINCYPAIYVEQAVQSILAGGRELIRFHYDPELYSPENPNTHALLQAIPRLEQLAAALDGQRLQGIAFYKPPDTDGEDEAYLLDYLGMLGLPMKPCHTFPHDAPAACLPVHAAADPQVSTHALSFVEKGGCLLLTPGFLRALASDTRVLELAGYATPPVTETDVWTFRFAVANQHAESETHVRFRCNLHPLQAETLATGIHSAGNVPVLTRHSYGTGKVLVLNAKTFRYPQGSDRVTTGEPVSLPFLPTALVNLLRAEMLSHLGLEVQVRSRVGIYCYQDILALTNFNDQAAEVRIALQHKHSGPAEWVGSQSQECRWVDGQLHCEIAGRQFMVVHVPRH